MTFARGRLVRVAVGVLGACGVLLLTSCGSTDGGTAATTPGGDASAPITGSQVDESAGPDTAPADAPTCASILPAETVDAFADVGWTSRQDPFYIGNIAMTDGLQCIWGNPEVASDDVQVYGWAPLDDDLAADVIAELSDQGWERSESDGAVYFTTPEDGPGGMAYRLTDDEITVSDTKQGLLLIEWPPQH